MTIAVLVACAWAGPVFAQSPATLIVETNYPEAVVYVDSLRVGLASQRQFQVPADARQVRLAAETGESWTITPVIRELSLQPDSVYRLQMDFPHYYRVRTIPFGAEVYLESGDARRRIGETPLLYRADAPIDSTIVVEHPGYMLQRLEPGREVWNEFEIVLEPAQAHAKATEVSWRPPSPPRYWIDYAAAGLAVAAGVLSVHYKFKADRVYDDYERTGDPALRPTIKAYDTRAGIALGAMQVGVGILAVRFALRR